MNRQQMRGRFATVDANALPSGIGKEGIGVIGVRD